MKETYSKFSNAVHANLRNHPHNYDKNSTAVGFSRIEFALLHNIIAEIDCHLQIKDRPKFPFKESLEFINYALADIKLNGSKPLLPDRGGLTTRDHVVWNQDSGFEIVGI